MTPAIRPISRTFSLRDGLIAVAALAALVLTLSLGRWQLSRAAQKEALQATLEQKTALPALGNQDFDAASDLTDLFYRRVHVRGIWQPEYTVYLDNRQMHGQPGFFVMTPLQLETTRQWVLVQRGWVPRNFLDRTQLAKVDTPTGVVELQGRLAPPPSKLLDFGSADKGAHSDPTSRSSRIRQNLDLVSFRTETQLPMLGVSLLQTGDASEGLQRDWPPVATGVEKHYGYAFQWFGLSGLIVILYVWFQIVRRIYPARRDPHAQAQ